MRDPNRLDLFYKDIKEIHKQKFPDIRFGQLMCNFFEWVMSSKGIDPFFPEEDKMIEYLKEYVNTRE